MQNFTNTLGGFLQEGRVMVVEYKEGDGEGQNTSGSCRDLRHLRRGPESVAVRPQTETVNSQF